MSNKQKAAVKLAKFIAYVLGHRPDEFGLVTDDQGFVKIKTLLQALHEEDGFRHVRPGHLKEIVMTLADAPLEMENSLIRARDRDDLILPQVAREIPPLLYTCVRRKAHPGVLKNGLAPTVHPKVILAVEKELAMRMGERIDPSPVLLTVQTQKAVEQGVILWNFGEALFLSGPIPPDCVTGPPLPKEKKESKKPAKTEPAPIHPGSFFLDLEPDKEKSKRTKRERQRKEIGWKKERQRMKRRKNSNKFK
jgi:putative RNA 2'-phosphotransferase